MPFLDNELVDLVLTLPAEQKSGRRPLQGPVPRRRCADLPPEPRSRRAAKTGFTPPQAAWFRGPQTRYVERISVTERACDARDLPARVHATGASTEHGTGVRDRRHADLDAALPRVVAPDLHRRGAREMSGRSESGLPGSATGARSSRATSTRRRAASSPRSAIPTPAASRVARALSAARVGVDGRRAMLVARRPRRGRAGDAGVDARTSTRRRALEAGKHVLVEKPLALSAAECDDLVASSRPRTASP